MVENEPAAQTLFAATKGAYTGKYAGFVPPSATAAAAAKAAPAPAPQPLSIVPRAHTLMRRFAQPEAGGSVAKLKPSKAARSSSAAGVDFEAAGEPDLGGGFDDDGPSRGRRKRR